MKPRAAQSHCLCQKEVIGAYCVQNDRRWEFECGTGTEGTVSKVGIGAVSDATSLGRWRLLGARQLLIDDAILANEWNPVGGEDDAQSIGVILQWAKRDVPVPPVVASGDIVRRVVQHISLDINRVK